MKTTELRFTENNAFGTSVVEINASDNGDTIMYVRLGSNEDYQEALHIGRDEARMLIAFLQTTFNL